MCKIGEEGRQKCLSTGTTESFYRLITKYPTSTSLYDEKLTKLNFILVNAGLAPSWYVQHVVVWDPQTDHMFFFLLEDWLSVENQKNGTVEKEVLASCKITLLFTFRNINLIM